MTKVLDWLSAIVLTGAAIACAVCGDPAAAIFYALGAVVAWGIVAGVRR